MPAAQSAASRSGFQPVRKRETGRREATSMPAGCGVMTLRPCDLATPQRATATAAQHAALRLRNQHAAGIPSAIHPTARTTSAVQRTVQRSGNQPPSKPDRMTRRSQTPSPLRIGAKLFFPIESAAISAMQPSYDPFSRPDPFPDRSRA